VGLGSGLEWDVVVDEAAATWEWRSGGGGEHELANATSSPSSSAAARCSGGCVRVEEELPRRTVEVSF
jgi:hypothetical protein